MKKLLWIPVVLCSFISCNQTEEKKQETKTEMNTEQISINQLTDAQKADGWQLLFDGVSASGWHKYGGGPAGNAWKVADGALYLDTATKNDGLVKDGGDIVSDSVYSNFDLKLDWKISKNGNSGIMWYVHEDSAKYKYPWQTGPEMQILDNEGHPDGKIIKHRAGDLYDLISCSVETVKAPGEWNQVEIRADKGKLDLFLNGTNVVSTTLWDENWKKMIAESKFKEWPDFGTFQEGKICLQDHGNMVWFRNIMIKRL
jgi:hypothetical protein